MCKFRTLKESEIDVRVAQTNQTKNGYKVSLLLYQDARAAMKLLDEVYPNRWKREQQMVGDRFCCTISIYDPELKEWISRQDVGTESNTEPEKGQASDAFKRAAVNWGIGRELYTAPKIDINLEEGDYFIPQNSPKAKVTATFRVTKIHYNEQREIDALEITKVNDKFGRITTKVVYSYGNTGSEVEMDDLPEGDVHPMPAQTANKFRGFEDAPQTGLKEVTESLPNMWKSTIGHAAMGESLEQVNDLLRPKGYYVSNSSWSRINSSF